MNLDLEILNCQKCDKYKEMPCGPVIGYGKSKIMLVGECPGKEESIISQPFVGLSGKLLDKMLNEAQISRKDLYITNLVKCISRKNNKNIPLSKSTINICSDWLAKEIQEIQPTLIIPLGKQATTYFLGKVKMEEVVGKISMYMNTTIIPCYHPSYLLQYGMKFIPDTIDILKRIREYL